MCASINVLILKEAQQFQTRRMLQSILSIMLWIVNILLCCLFQPVLSCFSGTDETGTFGGYYCICNENNSYVNSEYDTCHTENAFAFRNNERPDGSHYVLYEVDVAAKGLAKEIDLENLKSTVSEKKLEDKTDFFVVTTIFNPSSYQSRYHLYHNFAKHMNDTKAQLITIECIFPSLNQHEFQVTDSSNPWHIQLKSDSIYWMKENLINIAVSRLPHHAKWVAWLDADLSFDKENWVELTIKALEQYTVVQVFEKANSLGPSPKNEILRTDYSFGYSVVHNKSIDRKRYREWYPHAGYGWAMSVKDFRTVNGLPDFAIVGSGDRLFANGILNIVFDGFTAQQLQLPAHFKQAVSHYSTQNFNTLREITKTNFKSVVGYVPVTISHYWHGSKKYRQYHTRWNILSDNNFNILQDLRKTKDGTFKLNPFKPDIQSRLLTYFRTRHEDAIETDILDVE